MVRVLAKLKVEDYARWKTFFDKRSATREESGSKEAQLFLNLENKNEVVILFDWNDILNARKYMESDNVRKYLKDAGAEIVDVSYFDKKGTSI